MTSEDNHRSTDLQWTVRVSRRCRHARLQIKPFGGLEVVIPRHFPRYQIPVFIEQHRDWIRQKLQEQRYQQQSLTLPEFIHLAVDGSETEVIYGHSAGSGHSPSVIIASTGWQQQISELRGWIRQRAWVLLPPIVERMSRQTGIDYQKLTIRSQKTRWGSCSSQGTISLNDQLLFVKEETVEYLVIHELCHRRVMNHSTRFWRLVESFCSDYQHQEQALDQARHDVPDWFIAGLYC